MDKTRKSDVETLESLERGTQKQCEISGTLLVKGRTE